MQLKEGIEEGKVPYDKEVVRDYKGAYIMNEVLSVKFERPVPQPDDKEIPRQP